VASIDELSSRVLQPSNIFSLLEGDSPTEQIGTLSVTLLSQHAESCRDAVTLHTKSEAQNFGALLTSSLHSGSTGHTLNIIFLIRGCQYKEALMINAWKFSTVALVVSLGFVVATPSLKNQAQAEPQPVMKLALEQLEAAQKSLESATSDKGGHRAKALKYAKKAISEVKEGIAYDNKY
jgi:hypothetical protein